jgi:rhodanese-related sulfurtransferase
MLKTATVLSLALFLAPPLLPAAQASPLGLTPRETYALMRERGDEVLFIDVRDPVEIMFVGFTDVVDANIPFVLVNRDVWDEENNRFRLDPNPRFAQQVRQALEAKGLDESATVITMCRSGNERGEPSALALRQAGFSNARFVVNGFQGDRLKEGPHAGMRLSNGWQNAGLPWSSRLDGDKIHRTDR